MEKRRRGADPRRAGRAPAPKKGRRLTTYLFTGLSILVVLSLVIPACDGLATP